jgi:hypothetical protein
MALLEKIASKSLRAMLIPALAASLAIPACGSYKYYTTRTNEYPMRSWTEKSTDYETEKVEELKYHAKIVGNTLELKLAKEEYSISKRIEKEIDKKQVRVTEIRVEKYEPWDMAYVALVVGLICTGLSIAALASGGDEESSGSQEAKDAAGAALIFSAGSAIAGIVEIARKGSTREKVERDEVVTRIVDERTNVKPGSKKLERVYKLKNVEIEAYSEELGLNESGKTDEDGRISFTVQRPERAFLSYEEFENKKEIKDFKGLCDLKEAYEKLPRRKIPLRLVVKEKRPVSYDINVEVKDGSREAIEEALGKAGCF